VGEKLKEVGQVFENPLWNILFPLNMVLVVEPDYLPDSEVLAFSRVYTP